MQQLMVSMVDDLAQEDLVAFLRSLTSGTLSLLADE